ncbi:GntR family transcriptional regulator [Pollutimonas bauzanensis]|uniref:DNA-binding transcriptional regulator, GntR family n=1 Tax=Pollutimonas bauzanensis TaxID=658167 RepID=A0A1M6AZZ8_9BURK|nr:GntR family transcriptional regulator [Pollutimonas bauzanensis]SHI41888.1 DNA-binding transcriptional regulator, GntR family [Pollutimonas bauzanensis]
MKIQNNLASTVREKIEDEMAAGRYAPGELLDEKVLAERYGVSRTPVREAIQQLCAQGLVYHVPREGAFVAKLTSKELLALLELLAYQEGLCAMLAARRITADRLEAMQGMVERCEVAAKQGNYQLYAEENVAFHELLYASCRNEYLIRQVTALRRRSQLYRRNNFHQVGRMLESAADHRSILTAIEKQDEWGAFRAAVDHIAVAGRSFAEFLMTLQDEFVSDREHVPPFFPPDHH